MLWSEKPRQNLYVLVSTWQGQNVTRDLPGCKEQSLTKDLCSGVSLWAAVWTPGSFPAVLLLLTWLRDGRPVELE